MSGGKIALLVAGVLVALVGLGMAIGGGGLALGYGIGRGDDGFVSTPEYRMETDTYAITGERIDLGAVRGGGEWLDEVGDVDVRLRVRAADDGAVFVGIGPADEVDAYLEGVGHAEVNRLGSDEEVDYRVREGGAPAEPGAQGFWVASVEGDGEQTLSWDVTSGQWAIVVANADASAGVAVDAAAAARADFLLPLGIGILVVGLVLLGAGTAMIVVATAGGVSGGRRPEAEHVGAPGAATGAAGPAPGAAGGAGGGGAYPAVVAGTLDEPLSRWLWLVKWLLALPHFVVLAFLWLAFLVSTVIAGFAILFTGRYPPGIFEFNVGVLRWSWRVAFYSYGALGTDRYPAFTLQAVEGEPTSFDVAYPEQLSRGLVLVKWWLLALPHYLVLAVLTGGAVSWTFGTNGDWEWAFGGGLIGVLVFVAGVLLLVSGSYPRGLFDLLVGLNRWVYRVIAYAALMTDAYPPFRLDTGGADPGVPSIPPSGAPPQRAGTGGDLRT